MKCMFVCVYIHVRVWIDDRSIDKESAGQVGDPGKSWYCSSNLKAVWKQNSLFFGRNSVCFSLKVFKIGPTHIMEDNLIYSKAHDLNISSSKGVPSQQHLDSVLCTRSHNLAKVMHKMNHHSPEREGEGHVISVKWAIHEHGVRISTPCEILRC